jgi:hypothetical protein
MQQPATDRGLTIAAPLLDRYIGAGTDFSRAGLN